MRLGLYKKLFGPPEALNLNGKRVVVRQGETIVADARSMMGIRGFSFVRFVNDTPETLEYQNPPPLKGADQLGQEISIDEVEILTEVEVQEVQMQVVSENNQVMKEPEPPKQDSPKESGFSEEVINKLTEFNHRQWFAMKKADIKKYLTDANIDFSHLPDDKWKLVAFLKDLILNS